MNLTKYLMAAAVLCCGLLCNKMMAQSLVNLPLPSGKICEVDYSPYSTVFKVWAPTAQQVRVNIYKEGDGGVPIAQHYLVPGREGCWTREIVDDLEERFYTFQVCVANRWYDETPGLFAKAVGVNGKRAQVVQMSMTNPVGWENDRRPQLKSYADIVLYEMHHRDFSMGLESGILNKGKFVALTEENTHNASGLSTGVQHLKDLGVTHVHLLPSTDFGSIDETGAAAAYNWGYDPVNHNVPEGSFSTDPFNPATRIREFKQMVQTLHKAGIRVVMDVVYNHVYDAGKSQFERLVPGYFFRHTKTGKLANASGCGNETASEMPMMRKYMVESVLHWINEYHIDGFRFDLMGVHDIATMNAIRRAVDEVDPSIFIYGEGWAAEPPQLPESQLAMKGNMALMNRIAAFGDEMRDGLRGGSGDDRKGAFLMGVPGNEESVKFGIVGAVDHPQIDMTKVNYSNKAWAVQPTQMISYVSCHDDLCLADRLRATLDEKYRLELKDTVTVKPLTPKEIQRRADERVLLHKLAETVVLTSQGVPSIWCGDELMRDRKGVRNAYCSPDSVNAIDWSLKTKNRQVYEYVAQLIAMRKAHPAFRMGSADKVRLHLEFLPVEGDNLVAFKLDGNAVGDDWKTIIVVLNSNEKAAKVEVPLGQYSVVVRAGEANMDGLMKFKGHVLSVPAQSAVIMHDL